MRTNDLLCFKKAVQLQVIARLGYSVNECVYNITCVVNRVDSRLLRERFMRDVNQANIRKANSIDDRLSLHARFQLSKYKKS